jgi:hypothetical protein
MPPWCVSATTTEWNKQQMAKKKDRAFFVCPRWNELAGDAPTGGSGVTVLNRVHAKNLAAIREQRPVARSTLHKALTALRQATGKMFDADLYIEDQRATRAR